MYSYTTGGPFGLEEQISNSGPGMTLLYHLLIPFLWCIPISLVAAELTTAMPVQGGFYRVRGIQTVGRVSTLLEIFVLAPILVMSILGLAKWHHNPFVPVVPPHRPLFQVFGVGLALGVWLYSGYEQLSSVAEEVDNPRRNFPRALALVVPLSIATCNKP